MTATPRWGITLPLRSLPVPEQRDIVAALPDLGYTDAWSSELNGADAFTPLALAAQWTDRLRLGTAIAGIFTRGPALLATCSRATSRHPAASANSGRTRGRRRSPA